MMLQAVIVVFAVLKSDVFADNWVQPADYCKRCPRDKIAVAGGGGWASVVCCTGCHDKPNMDKGEFTVTVKDCPKPPDDVNLGGSLCQEEKSCESCPKDVVKNYLNPAAAGFGIGTLMKFCCKKPNGQCVPIAHWSLNDGTPIIELANPVHGPSPLECSC